MIPNSENYLFIKKEHVLFLDLNVFVGGGPSGQVPQLAKTGLVSIFEVEQNDDPYGLFAVATLSQSVSIAEDYYPGLEHTTQAQITIERKQGKTSKIQVFMKCSKLI